MRPKTEPEWTALVGQHVELWKDGRLVRNGYVDAVAPAMNALWLKSEGVDQRAIYDMANGYYFWPTGEATA